MDKPERMDDDEKLEWLRKSIIPANKFEMTTLKERIAALERRIKALEDAKGSFNPAKIFTNADLAAIVDTPYEWM